MPISNEVRTHQKNLATAVINGVTASGFASEGAIAAERTNDSATPSVDLYGGVTMNISPDRSGTITMLFQATSTTLETISQLARDQESGNPQPFEVSGTDSTGRRFEGSGCFVQKMPPLNTGTGEVAEIEVVFVVSFLDMHIPG
jgi:hypothetical protein